MLNNVRGGRSVLQLCMECAIEKALLVMYLLCGGQGTSEASDLPNLWRGVFFLFVYELLFVFLVNLLLLCFCEDGIRQD